MRTSSTGACRRRRPPGSGSGWRRAFVEADGGRLELRRAAPPVFAIFLAVRQAPLVGAEAPRTRAAPAESVAVPSAESAAVPPARLGAGPVGCGCPAVSDAFRERRRRRRLCSVPRRSSVSAGAQADLFAASCLGDRYGLGDQFGVGREFFREHPLAVGPEPERHADDGADDVRRDEVRDTDGERRVVRGVEPEHVLRQGKRHQVQGQRDSVDHEEEHRLVVLLAAAAPAEGPFAVQHVAQDGGDQDGDRLGGDHLVRQHGVRQQAEQARRRRRRWCRRRPGTWPARGI